MAVTNFSSHSVQLPLSPIFTHQFTPFNPLQDLFLCENKVICVFQTSQTTSDYCCYWLVPMICGIRCLRIAECCTRQQSSIFNLFFLMQGLLRHRQGAHRELKESSIKKSSCLQDWTKKKNLLQTNSSDSLQ